MENNYNDLKIFNNRLLLTFENETIQEKYEISYEKKLSKKLNHLIYTIDFQILIELILTIVTFNTKKIIKIPLLIFLIIDILLNFFYDLFLRLKLSKDLKIQNQLNTISLTNFQKNFIISVEILITKNFILLPLILEYCINYEIKFLLVIFQLIRILIFRIDKILLFLTFLFTNLISSIFFSFENIFYLRENVIKNENFNEISENNNDNKDIKNIIPLDVILYLILIFFFCFFEYKSELLSKIKFYKKQNKITNQIEKIKEKETQIKFLQETYSESLLKSNEGILIYKSHKEKFESNLKFEKISKSLVEGEFKEIIFNKEKNKNSNEIENFDYIRNRYDNYLGGNFVNSLKGIFGKMEFFKTTLSD